MKYLVLALLCLFSALQVNAGKTDGDKGKTRTVTGRVVDQHGESIPGATITVRETGEQSFADLDGNFQLTVPLTSGYSVSITTIGYQVREIHGAEFPFAAEHVLEPLK